MLIINLTDKYEHRFEPCLLDIDECLSQHGLLREMRHSRRFHGLCNDVIPFVDDDRNYGIKPVLEQIPVYLVTTEQSKKSIDVAHWGHVDSVLVPDHDGMTIYEDNLHTMVDYLGLYQLQILNNKNGYRGIEDVKPSIFIWADKIYDYVIKHINKDDYEDEFDYEVTVKNRYNALTAQVILHELMHAVMDNMLLGFDASASIQSSVSRFVTFKEESLANAMALVLLEQMVADEDWEFVIDFVKHQPDEYSLALDYLSLSVFSYAGYWLAHKDGHSFDPKIMQEWMSFVSGTKPLDTHQLDALESGLHFHEGLFRFNGKFFDNHDVCVEVIKHFANNCDELTRQKIHDAFPDNLNANFEAIIDYPETNEFHDKEDDHTRSISEENIIHCSDGDVVVCDYWHPNDMPGFLKNAQKLGFTIEAF